MCRFSGAPVFMGAGPVSSVCVAGSAENTRFRFSFRYIYPGGDRFLFWFSGFDIGNEFKDKFVEQGYTTITEANAAASFKNVSNDKLISFLLDNYSERTQIINIKKHIDSPTLLFRPL